MRPELQMIFMDECPPFPKRSTKKGQCKYPFERLDAPGKGVEIPNRSFSSVKQAVRRWLDAHASSGVKLAVRVIDGKVRVRRER